MSPKKLKEIIKLLKTGNFTIYCSDNGVYSIYKGKLTQEQIEESFDSGFLVLDPEFEIEDWRNEDGYITPTLLILTKAFGGKIHST